MRMCEILYEKEIMKLSICKSTANFCLKPYTVAKVSIYNNFIRNTKNESLSCKMVSKNTKQHIKTLCWFINDFCRRWILKNLIETDKTQSAHKIKYLKLKVKVVPQMVCMFALDKNIQKVTVFYKFLRLTKSQINI